MYVIMIDLCYKDSLGLKLPLGPAHLKVERFCLPWKYASVVLHEL